MSKRTQTIRAAKQAKQAGADGARAAKQGPAHAAAFVAMLGLLQHRCADSVEGQDFDSVLAACAAYDDAANAYDEAHADDIATGLAFMDAEDWSREGGSVWWETVSGRMRFEASDAQVVWSIFERGAMRDGRGAYLRVVMRGDDVECQPLNWTAIERLESGTGVSHVVDFIIPIAGGDWMPERLRAAVAAELVKREVEEARRAEFAAMPPPERGFTDGGSEDFGLFC